MNLIQALVQNTRIMTEGDDHLRQAAERRQKSLEDRLPSGGGFDNGTEIVSVSDSKVVFRTAFHHMDDAGYYDGWTEHVVTVRPSLLFGITVTVSGKNKNGIKWHITDVFYAVLTEPLDWYKG